MLIGQVHSFIGDPIMGIMYLLEETWYLGTARKKLVARSSVETEYRVMALITCELIWLKHLLEELQFEETRPMTLVWF